MLRRLSFTNFKSWPKADLTFAPITGLFGTNSSGKTSLIQFLLMLKQTKDATDRALALELNGAYVQLGTIRDAIHGHDEARAISLSVTFAPDDPLSLQDPTGRNQRPIASGKEITLSTKIVVRQKAPQAESLSYTLGDVSFSLKRGSGKEKPFDLAASDPSEKFRFIRTQGRPWGLPGPVKSYAFPDEARTYFQNAAFLADLEAAYEASMNQLFYLGPLRERPKRDYPWALSRWTDVGQKGEKAIDAILAATLARETQNLKPKARLMPFERVIAHWLRQMGLTDSFTVEEIKEGSNRWQAWVTARPKAPKVLLTDVGFGVSQVLPVITLLYYVPEGSTVILEQPEIHLHPLAQSHLADVIINVALHRRVQVIVESHSEHLLIRLQRRIAEGELPQADVRLYFCDAPQGVSRLTPLELDLLGTIQNWPKDFMGDAFGETAKAELARLKRMRNAAE